MARKKVIDLNADSTLKFEKPGQKFQGYYVGSKTVNSGMGPSQLHVFQTDEGNVGVWGSAQLNAKLAQCLGYLTFITYLKKIKVPKGTMKTFEVEYDDEQKIDVAGTQVNFRQTEEPSESEEEIDNLEASAEEESLEEEAEEEQVEEESEEELPPAKTSSRPAAAGASRPRAAAASPQSQARVTSILNKRK